LQKRGSTQLDSTPPRCWYYLVVQPLYYMLKVNGPYYQDKIIYRSYLLYLKALHKKHIAEIWPYEEQRRAIHKKHIVETWPHEEWRRAERRSRVSVVTSYITESSKMHVWASLRLVYIGDMLHYDGSPIMAHIWDALQRYTSLIWLPTGPL
jgi:hypothetical protein